MTHQWKERGVRVMTWLLTAWLIGATPMPPPVRMGRFQEWLSFKRAPIAFTSGGVNVRVEPLPCPAEPTGDTSCRWDKYNNQGRVTVRAPGMMPISIVTDRQSAYARVAVVRFDRRDAQPGVIIESQSGGSGGDMTAQFLIPAGNRFRVVPLKDDRWGYLQGEIRDDPRDLSGDGRVDFQLADAGFDSVFGCNACTPRPPLFFAVKDGQIIDETRDRALRAAFLEDMQRWAPRCFSQDRDRNGSCAAYVADAARAGVFEAAWARMLAHYEHGVDMWQPCDVPASQWVDHRCPVGHGPRFRDFPESLRAFLIKAKYLPA